MADNSDLRQKIAIRHAALKHLGRKPEVVLEYFAGEGVMTNMLWSAVASAVISIEKDGNKAALIKGASTVITGDNNNYIHLANDACIIDCDAYGLVMPFISKLPSNKLVVFTDGTLYAGTKNYSLIKKLKDDLENIFSISEVIESFGGTAYYGWGVTK